MTFEDQVKQLINTWYPKFNFDQRIKNLQAVPAPWNGGGYGISYTLDGHRTTHKTINDNGNIVSQVAETMIAGIKKGIKDFPLVQLDDFYFDSQADQIYDADIRAAANKRKVVIFYRDLRGGSVEVLHYAYNGRKNYGNGWELLTRDHLINTAEFKKLRGEEVSIATKIEYTWIQVSSGMGMAMPVVNPDKTKILIPEAFTDGDEFHYSEIIEETKNRMILLWDVGEIGIDLIRKFYLFKLTSIGTIEMKLLGNEHEYNSSLWLNNVAHALDTEQNPFNIMAHHLLQYAPYKYKSDHLFITHTGQVYVNHNSSWIHLSEDSKHRWETMMTTGSWLEWTAYNNVKNLP